MLDHLALQCADVDASATFYSRVFAATGVREAMRFPGTLSAPSREAVDAVHAAALEAGAEVLHAPRVWPEYHPGYYGVFFRDPDGNNVEAVHHGPPPAEPGM